MPMPSWFICHCWLLTKVRPQVLQVRCFSSRVISESAFCALSAAVCHIVYSIQITTAYPQHKQSRQNVFPAMSDPERVVASTAASATTKSKKRSSLVPDPQPVEAKFHKENFRVQSERRQKILACVYNLKTSKSKRRLRNSFRNCLFIFQADRKFNLRH